MTNKFYHLIVAEIDCDAVQTPRKSIFGRDKEKCIYAAVDFIAETAIDTYRDDRVRARACIVPTVTNINCLDENAGTFASISNLEQALASVPLDTARLTNLLLNADGSDLWRRPRELLCCHGMHNMVVNLYKLTE